MTNARILIVEDEAITVSALKRELVSLGYEVAATASTADEALKTVELHKPDLVLMDITLAGTVNGIVGAVAIRGNFHVPVVFLTAHADAGTMERAVAAGAFGYVLKPFSGAGLKAAIETALHKHQTEIENRRAADLASRNREPRLISDMEHRLKSLCATQVSRLIFLPGRDFCLEGIWVQ